MPTGADRLADCLLVEGGRVVAAFRNLAPEDWQRPICTEGTRWTAHELLAHLVSVELGKHTLLDTVVVGGQSASESHDADIENAHRVPVLAALPVADLLRQFIEARRANVQRVGCMHANDLDCAARGPLRGNVAVEEIVTAICRHDQTHLRELRAALESPCSQDAHEPAP